MEEDKNTFNYIEIDGKLFKVLKEDKSLETIPLTNGERELLQIGIDLQEQWERGCQIPTLNYQNLNSDDISYCIETDHNLIVDDNSGRQFLEHIDNVKGSGTAEPQL